jgi:hypothetical protein
MRSAAKGPRHKSPRECASHAPKPVVALHLNRRLWPFTALNSALTQFWCTCGTIWSVCACFIAINFFCKALLSTALR